MADTKREINNVSSQSRVVLAKPRLGGCSSSSFGASTSSKEWNPFGSCSSSSFGASTSSKERNTLGPVLRPPQFKSGNNPFLKVAEISEDKEKNSGNVNTINDDKTNEEAPKFVPLGSGNANSRATNSVPTPVHPANNSSSSGFVFGQNLSERVVINENLNNGEAVPDHSSTNGSTELLFTSAAASVKESNQEEQNSNETSGGDSLAATSSGDGLAAAAAEYERSHARPPPPTVNVTMTGEEDEINVLQISCRLFAWEAGSWRERGRGVLRLNDAAGGRGARVVARVAGSLRVVLNTNLWPDMVLERAGNKSLRITAADANQLVKLYLIMGAPADIDQLHKALMARVDGYKRTVTISKSASQQAAERLEATTEEDSIDKQTTPVDNADDNIDKDQNELETSVDVEDRLALENKSDHESNMNEDRELQSLKRKEPSDDQTPPKRQCADVSDD